MAFPEIKESLKIAFLIKTEHDLSFVEIPEAVSLPEACLDCVGPAEYGARLQSTDVRPEQEHNPCLEGSDGSQSRPQASRMQDVLQSWSVSGVQGAPTFSCSVPHKTEL